MRLSFRRILPHSPRFICLGVMATVFTALAMPALGKENRGAVYVDFKALEILKSEDNLFHHLPAPDETPRSRLHVPGPPSYQKPLAAPTLKKPKLLTKPRKKKTPSPASQPKHLTPPSIEIKAPSSPSEAEQNRRQVSSQKKDPSLKAVKELKPRVDPLDFAPAVLSLAFHPNEVQIPKAAREHLDILAKDMLTEKHRQARLMSYASGSKKNPAKARRTSLARALAIRSYLLKKGIQSSRIGLRALGKQAPDGKKDRVDIVLTTP